MPWLSQKVPKRIRDDNLGWGSSIDWGEGEALFLTGGGLSLR